MSNKMDATETKHETKSSRMPRLRFPEFQDAPEWEENKLDDIASFYKGKGVSKADVDLQGETPCIRYGELYTIYGEIIKTVFSKTKLPASELFLSRKNDVIIPGSGETKLDIAKASCVLLNDVALGGDLNILRSNENGIFLSYLLNGPYKRKIAKKAQGDTVVHLYPSQLKLLEVAIPKINEQQKIADCLASLDELITTHSQKLDALKTHKKGLLQQLFPAEGETVPRLRFPEFQNAPEWGKRELSDFIAERNQISNGNIVLFSLTIEGGVTPKTERYERSFLVSNEENAYKVILQNDFAYNPMNLRLGAIGRYAGEEPVALSKYYNIFYCDQTVDSRFCEFYFRSDSLIMFYDKMATGSLIEKKRVHFNDFLKFKIPFPPLPEQQKIADCLSSLDERIAAQRQKLDALKTHKKGLLQQLFPVPDEVEG